MNASQHSRAAELGLIASALFDNDVLEDVQLDSSDFYDLRHDWIWATMVDLHSRGRTVDFFVLSNALTAQAHQDGATPDYLNSILGAQSTSRVQAVDWAHDIAGHAQIRRAAQHGVRAQDLAAEATPDTVEDVLDTLRADLEAIAARTQTSDSHGLLDVMEESMALWTGQEEIEAYTTGWAELDELLNGGWVPGQVTVVGARPAVGKSLVATCAAVAGLRYGVGFVSMEMSEREVVSRMASDLSGVFLSKLTSGTMTDPRDREAIARVMQHAPEWRFKIQAKPRRSVSQIRSMVRSWQKEHPIKLVVIDYLQLMAGASSRQDFNEQERLSKISEDVKVMARELDVHVLLLAQLNRGAAQREGQLPTMADLKGSGGIEANADNIVLLHRENTGDSTEQRGTGDAETITFRLVKNRHGQTRDIRLLFRAHVASINPEDPTPFDYPHGLPHQLPSYQGHALAA